MLLSSRHSRAAVISPTDTLTLESGCQGDKWEEEWETAALIALNAETGKRLYSNCGQKKGVTKEGKMWSETWGKDDLLGMIGKLYVRSCVRACVHACAFRIYECLVRACEAGV